MRIRIFPLVVFLILAAMIPPAAAQEETRLPPQSREQVTLSFAPLVKQVAPAVVNIYSKQVVVQRYNPFMSDPFFEQFFGGGGLNFDFGGLSRQRIESALGSGVIVESDGLVVTNAHVVRDAEEITVVLPDGREFPARKALEDEPSDLALLRIDTGGQKLPYVTLKPSETLEVGDLVLAIGNPFGVGQTVTSGIVSALARSSLNISDFNFFIQTDAAINPGNSGGPLVAMDGGVIGINSAIYSRDGGSLGIGFAIPSEMVATVIAAEKAGQAGGHGVVRAWLGVTTQRVTGEIAESLGLAMPGGVLIANLHRASPAREAGLRTGDIVLAVNGKTVREPAEMKFRMATVPIGSQADFEILRDGVKQVIHVAAIAPPEDPPRQETDLTGNHPFNGVSVANISPAVAVELGVSEEEGVVVTAVEKRRYGISIVRPGDVIDTVNGMKIATVGSLKKALERSSPDGWQLILLRDGRTHQVILR